MSSPDRIALERALVLAREQVATLEAALRSGSDVPASPIALKAAAYAMGVEPDTLRKRALRNTGAISGMAFVVDGAWHFHPAYVEARRRRAG